MKTSRAKGHIQYNFAYIMSKTKLKYVKNVYIYVIKKKHEDVINTKLRIVAN